MRMRIVETPKHASSDSLKQVQCVSCGQTLQVLLEAKMVFCPSCSTVSPCDGSETAASGVGCSARTDTAAARHLQLYREGVLVTWGFDGEGASPPQRHFLHAGVVRRPETARSCKERKGALAAEPRARPSKDPPSSRRETRGSSGVRFQIRGFSWSSVCVGVDTTHKRTARAVKKSETWREKAARASP